MSSNFKFLKDNTPFIYENATNSEKSGITDPRVACMYARFTLEATLKWMYQNDVELYTPWENSLNAMLKEKSFKDTTPPQILKSCEIIRKYGNKALHEQRKVTSNTSIFVVESLFHVLYWFTRMYFDEYLTVRFNSELIPTGKESQTSLKQVLELEKKAKEAEEKHNKELEKERAKSLTLEQELKKLKLTILQNKQKAREIPDNHDYNEAETRRRFIDLLLSEAGWHIDNEDVDLEHELLGVERNKNRTGTGFADYVLYGNDGKPLAVVEAKRTSADPVNGKQQACDYANALEKKYGQRPIIFYTNGYTTHVWDDSFYPPEQVQGFYKKEELQRIVNRRDNRVLNLSEVPVDEAIAGGNGRTYQKLAIKAVGDHIQTAHKRGLLVMATGTGKTRTTIALVKQLQQANWTKRTLFLCDRISLLSQAKKAFTNLLPNTPAVDLRSDKTNTTARLCLSTYGTMMGLIDEVQNGTRLFSPGHFDLIVLDEAHRSVYQKYGAIFDYFDSLLIGLTATPKKEIDKNTYDLFRIQDDIPSYNYTLEEAINAGHLVDFKAVRVGTELTRNGLTYKNLSEEEKEDFELHFSDEDTGELPDKIDSSALNQWLFNKDTVDGILKSLMTEGIKIDGGDNLGKTIIFAKNKDHAKFIVERFDINYPHYKGHFCRRIDYSLGKDAEVLIDQFKEKDFPRITVSVDMLDTGIDVPAVVNLVFAKPVYSNTKFWQMIGRGTRLCENLFGPGEHKEYFQIFDCCENFAFFEMKPDGVKGRLVEPISQKIFNRHLYIAHGLNKSDEEDEKELRSKYLDFLHTYVTNMEEDNFIIRPHLEFVRKYNNRDAWNILDNSKLSEITRIISPLPSTLDLDDQDAKQFDLLLLNTQLALLESDALRFNKNRNSIHNIATNIKYQLSNMPDVKKILPFIEAITEDSYWNDISVVMIEEIRIKLRLFIKFLEVKERKKVYSNFKDEQYVSEDIDTGNFFPRDLKKYKERMESIINKMCEDNNLTLYKLRHNKPVTQLDLEELDRQLFAEPDERKRFKEVYSSKFRSRWTDIENPPLSLLLRSIVGLDRADVEEEFSKFVTGSSYTSVQYKFVQQIIEYMCTDGFISPEDLYDPPFSDIHHGGPEAVFGDKTNEVFEIIEEMNNNALQCAI